MDYGMAVSQKGYDVKTCADRFLVYSSAFQTLKIFSTFTSSTTIPGSGTNTITITHNLGYYAPYIIIYNGSTGSGSRGTGQSFFMSDSSFDFTNRQYTNRLEFDVDSGFDIFGSSSGNTVYFTVYIFLDDFRTVSAKNINSGTSSGSSSSDYGIRISKNGFDVKTCANNDCVLSSSFFNQIVHMKGIAPGNTTVTHNLGYPANFLNYTLVGSSYLQYFGITGVINNTIFDPQEFVDNTYYIIFKDNLT